MTRPCLRSLHLLVLLPIPLSPMVLSSRGRVREQGRPSTGLHRALGQRLSPASLDPRVSYYPSPQEVGLVESLILDLLDPERKVNALSELRKNCREIVL